MAIRIHLGLEENNYFKVSAATTHIMFGNSKTHLHPKNILSTITVYTVL